MASRFATPSRRSTIPFWEGACFSRHLEGLVAGHWYTSNVLRFLGAACSCEKEIPRTKVSGISSKVFAIEKSGCQLFQEHCQTYQEYVNISSIATDNHIRKRAKNVNQNQEKTRDRQPSTVNFICKTYVTHCVSQLVLLQLRDAVAY